MTSPDLRLVAPAAARNRDPILDVLRDALPAAGVVLELASGSGEHIVHFARALPALQWQPSDPSPDACASITAWTATEGLDNIAPPLALDAAGEWPAVRADAILCINMIHISPWAATEGLMRGAGAILPPGGLLYLYGPYRRAGVPLEPSNAAFDADLRARNPAWGLRDLDNVSACAAEHGLRVEAVLPMPANNLSVLLRRV
ncbi:DUF938 domain-containing protein [Novosphingobium humi]|uniref:DUF938 domain-containing protein n=1 Tax=Novosphingobium humi TaxID=2282397 RepID=A0ABY7TSL1_9SPHN|nr:DUF938 domain-containing protein [Novosphingobium humi]WCT76205.1 DUF938 domain-containing protein [Novosphingobium humi]WJS97333.1 class I SAM-dependent methyltransferase [Novosphingobium humi]